MSTDTTATTAGTGAIGATSATDATGASAPVSRAEYCVIAALEAFRGDGEVLASAFGTIPTIAVRLARATIAPDLLLTDGEAHLVQGIWPVGTPAPGPVEAWLPFRSIFDLLWHGPRHVMMIPSQIDRYGNANISAVGPYEKPKVQLLGVRGAPGNSVSHPTSYWVAKHSPRVFVEKVDMVSGVGNDRALAAGPGASRHHGLRRVITNLAALDYAEDGTMRVVSIHPGVSRAELAEATGFALVGLDDAPLTREPTAEELHLIRDVLDPRGLRDREVPA